MAFTPKNWQDAPLETTPLGADDLEDLETRLAAYADSRGTGGIELGYAEITSNYTRTGAGTDDVSGLEVTVTVATRPITVEFGCAAISNSAAGGLTLLSINEGATTLATATYGVEGAAVSNPVSRKVRLAPTAGSHTYKITLGQVVSGNCTIAAAATSPAFIQVVEV